jgi:hypothetical protein
MALASHWHGGTRMASKQQQQVGRQEGSRWINRRPEPDEFAKWFRENVRVHDGLEHAHYLPGITLIPNKEKVKEVRLDEQGNPQIVDVEQMVWTPYPKVETRVAYFWDFMFLHPEWRGKIKLVPHATVENFPEHFFRMTGTDATGKPVPFVGVSYQIEILIRGRRGEPVIEPPAGTKIVALNRKGYNGTITPDENAIHKAQTGGIGRALGFAGMLMVPGAGIATAEDMLEFLAGESPMPGTEPTLPPVTEPTAAAATGQATDLDGLIAAHIERLQAEYPHAYDEARAWAREKGYDLDHPPEVARRGLERLLRTKLASAEKQAAASEPPVGVEIGN